MTQEEIIKKKKRRKLISESDGHVNTQRFPTLARIVSSNGSLVAEIPKLPTSSLALTTYDHLRIGLGHAALATCCLNRLESASVPKLMLSSDWDNIRLNLEDLMNHLYYAIEGWPESKGRS